MIIPTSTAQALVSLEISSTEDLWKGDVLGRCVIGAAEAIIVKAPFISPAPPIPPIALPTMNIVEETEAAEIKAPNSKIARKVRKVHYILQSASTT